MKREAITYRGKITGVTAIENGRSEVKNRNDPPDKMNNEEGNSEEEKKDEEVREDENGRLKKEKIYPH